MHIVQFAIKRRSDLDFESRMGYILHFMNEADCSVYYFSSVTVAMCIEFSAGLL